MKMSEISCANCGTLIIINSDRVRKQMFCTLGCMVRFEEKEKYKNFKNCI